LLYYDEYNNAYFGSYDDIVKINQKYMALAVNRKSQKRKGSSASVNRRQIINDSVVPSAGFNGTNSTLLNAVTDQKFTFTPKINDLSRSIAESKFKDQLSSMTHHDHLLQ
jgi:hypothetical protein